jgi:hypothetical protein
MNLYNIVFLASVSTGLLVAVIATSEVIRRSVESLEVRTTAWWSAWPGFTLTADALPLHANGWVASTEMPEDLEPLPAGIEVIELDTTEGPESWAIDGRSVTAGTSFRR